MSISKEVEEEGPPRPHWFEWCEKNSQPKHLNRSRPRLELTRWQKRGPMTRKDWVRFYTWAAKNAVARSELPTKGKAAQPTKPKRKKHLDVERIEKLAYPKMPRGKYVYPEPEDFPWSPKIHWKLPANKDPGRPFEPPEVPKEFQHIEVEIEFWNRLRFPIRPSAFKFVPSPNLLALAQPRVIYADQLHCPLPEVVPEYIPPRIRMTRRQWREHLRRLEYLAKPVSRCFYIQDITL